MSIEILPCPHCGNQPHTEHVPPHKHYLLNLPPAPDTWVIECRCGAGMCGHDSYEELLARWNRREKSALKGEGEG